MNSLFENLSTPDAQACAEKASPKADPASLIAGLADGASEISDTQLMGALDDFPHDQALHAAIIARFYLPDTVVMRLVALVSPDLADSLISRHPLPEKYRREVMKNRPSRPEWWSRGLLNIGR